MSTIIKEQTLSAPFTWASTLEILEGVKVDEVGVKDRVSSLATRSIKRESKLQALNYIVSMCDLTTLEKLTNIYRIDLKTKKPIYNFSKSGKFINISK